MKRQGFLLAALLMLLLLILSTGAGYLVQYYFPASSLINELILRILVLTLIGIISGSVCRIGIPKDMVFAKILYAFSGSLSSLLILDLFMTSSFSILDDEHSFKTMQWGDWTQLVCLVALSILITLIGKQKGKKAQPVRRKKKKQNTIQTFYQNTGTSISAFFSNVKNRTTQLFTKKKPTKKKSTSTTKKKTTTTRRSPSSGKTQTRSTVKINPKKTTKTTVKVAKKKTTSRRGKKKNDNVKLVGTEEHRCPYCLELVRKNDRRGVVVCPDCGTWHHKDCWNVTGSCQIAHKHEL